jgi:hypothetical protein
VSAEAPLTRRGNIRWGLALIAMAAGVAGLIRSHPERLNAPAWVAYTAVSSFFFAGLLLLTTAAARPRLERWIAVVLVLAMTLPGAWIAFGAGERRCTSNVPFLVLPPAAVCRAAFGLGTFLMVAVLVYFVRLAVTPRAPG